MSPNDSTLHSQAPDTSGAALLAIDVINDFDFDGAEALLAQAAGAAEQIAALIGRARRAGIPIVYVNDNFGRWQSDLGRLLDHALAPEARGRAIVERLRPGEHDYFVLKPKHSGFYSTTLDLLLRHLRATTVILVGFAGNICVLFTANDAYMRDLQLIVPRDCIASNTPEENANALTQMQRVLKADTRPAAELDFEALRRLARPTRG